MATGGRSPGKGHHRRVLSTESLCRMVLASDRAHAFIFLLQSCLRNTRIIRLITLTGTTCHFTSYGMFAEDMNTGVCRWRVEGTTIFQLGSPWFPETRSQRVNQTPLSGALYSTQDPTLSGKLKPKSLLYIRFIRNAAITKSLWACVENTIIKLN